MEHTDELTKLRNEVAAQTEFELKTLENNFKAKLPPSGRPPFIMGTLHLHTFCN